MTILPEHAAAFYENVLKHFTRQLNRELRYAYDYAEELSSLTAARVAYKNLVREWVEREFNIAFNCIDNTIVECCYRTEECLALARTIGEIVKLKHPYIFGDGYEISIYGGYHGGERPDILYKKKKMEEKDNDNARLQRADN